MSDERGKQKNEELHLRYYTANRNGWMVRRNFSELVGRCSKYLPWIFHQGRLQYSQDGRNGRFQEQVPYNQTATEAIVPAEPNPSAHSEDEQARVYTWSFPGSPIRIQIALDVIWRLNLEIDLELEANGAGAAINGLLLGEMEGGPWETSVLHINDYTCLENDGARDGEAIASRMAAAAGETRNVVGVFRTQPESRPVVREQDQPLLAAANANVQAVLLIAVGEPERRLATFLFREGETIHPFGFLDFEFDATAKRRPEFAPDGFRVAEISEADFSADAASENAQGSDGGVVVRPSRTHRRQHSFQVAVAALAGILAGAFGTLGVWLLLTLWTSSNPLHLRATASEQGVALTWTPPRGNSNTGGRLVVRGAEVRAVIELDAEQIRAGKLFYGPVGENSTFRLEIGPASSPSEADSVSAVRAPAAKFESPRLN